MFLLVDVERIGVVGHSFGGSAALGVGRARDDIRAVIALEAPYLADIEGVQDGEFVWIVDPYPVPVLNIYSDSAWPHPAEWPQYATQGPEAHQHPPGSVTRSRSSMRVHRRGEGAPHTGLKPAGLDIGPVIPLAEQAVDTGDAGPLIAFLQHKAEQARHRLAHVGELQAGPAGGVPAARAYTSAMLRLLLLAHRLWRQTAQSHDPLNRAATTRTPPAVSSAELCRVPLG